MIITLIISEKFSKFQAGRFSAVKNTLMMKKYILKGLKIGDVPVLRR